MPRTSLSKHFCKCIKDVEKTVNLRPGQTNKESAAIAICVKSVLQSQGRTLKKFKCGPKPMIRTQKPLNRTRRRK